MSKVMELDFGLFQPDEHSQTDILTSASNRLPAFPSPLMHA